MTARPQMYRVEPDGTQVPEPVNHEGLPAAAADDMPTEVNPRVTNPPPPEPDDAVVTTAAGGWRIEDDTVAPRLTLSSDDLATLDALMRDAATQAVQFHTPRIVRAESEVLYRHLGDRVRVVEQQQAEIIQRLEGVRLLLAALVTPIPAPPAPAARRTQPRPAPPRPPQAPPGPPAPQPPVTARPPAAARTESGHRAARHRAGDMLARVRSLFGRRVLIGGAA